MKKKIIIFGSTGNVGAYVHKYACDFFPKDKYEIIATGRRDTQYFSNLNLKYYMVDISNSEDFSKLPKDNVYAVINLAAQIPSYMKDYFPEKYMQSNIIGTYNILEYCRQAKADRILFSTTVFDVSLSVQEGKKIDPLTPYNFSYKGDHALYVITKNTSIELMKHYYEEYGLKYFIFRFPTIYNYSPYPYYFPNGKKTMRPVYTMINNAIQSKPIELWGNPNYSKDMVHVYDCAQMMCKAVLTNLNYGFYNVGTGKPVTLEKQIKTIIEVFSPKEKRSEIIYRPEKPSGGGFLMNIENAVKELGYKPKYDVKKLFEDYKKEMKINRFHEFRVN